MCDLDSGEAGRRRCADLRRADEEVSPTASAIPPLNISEKREVSRGIGHKIPRLSDRELTKGGVS